MAGITAAAISAGAGIVGDMMSSSSTSSTNAQQIAANEEMQRAAFAFDQQQQLQAENYDTQMSNTAMQRRVEDLKAAGINPLLAVSQGGASTPVVSGATGPGGNVGSLTPPGQAYSNLGGIASSAVQAYNQVTAQQAQTKLTEAQADKAQSDATIQRMQVPFAANNAYYNNQELQNANAKLKAEADTAFLQYNIQDATAGGIINKLNTDNQFKADVVTYLLRQEQLETQMMKNGMPGSTNDATYQNSPWGKILNAIGFGEHGGGAAAAAAAGTAAKAAAALAE